MYIPETPYTSIALQSLTHYLNHGSLSNLILNNIPDELYHQKCGCFVSLHCLNGDLRGCIGTIEPKEKNLVMEISRNAVSSAMYDSRFEPITQDELDGLTISVDVLSKPEPVSNLIELNPHIFGVIVSDGRYNKAVLLPDLDSVHTIEKQLDIVKRKAGLSDIPTENLIIHRFTSDRYK